MNDMQRVLDAQKKHFIDEGSPSIELRVDRLNRLKSLIIDNRYDFVDALNEDYGNRSKNTSIMTDAYSIVPDINNAIKNIKKWTKTDKRSSNFPFGLFGAKSYVRHEPLGTVGMVSPWNFPVNLSFGPLAAIFAAGNQVMHKPSELTPLTAALIKDLCDKSYDENEFATFLGGPEVGEAFTKLHFDHLLYTGSGNIGKHVMQSASQNLVPVTLELGGKSPVVIGNSADMKVSAKRIMFGKTLNAGQICLAPDYVIVHKDKKEEFIKEAENAIKEFYPSIKDNDDYSSIINERHYNRINSLVDDAKEKGAHINQINPSSEDFSQQQFYKIPPTIVTNTTDDTAEVSVPVGDNIVNAAKVDSDLDDDVVLRAEIANTSGAAAGFISQDDLTCSNAANNATRPDGHICGAFGAYSFSPGTFPATDFDDAAVVGLVTKGDSSVYGDQL